MTALHHRHWPIVARSVDDLVAVLLAGAVRGEAADEPIDAFDPIDQLEHGLQCAQLLQMTHPDDPELHVAGLLHDIGHTLVPGDVGGHGRNARRWVEPLLGTRVGRLIELHVPAKRYLVGLDDSYRRRLSPGSVRTLAAQGDVLTEVERAAFEADPHHRDAVILRRADEGAKVAGIDAGRLDDWTAELAAVAARRRAELSRRWPPGAR